MRDMFKEIYEKETNETTALILMLGVLSEKLTDITTLIERSNKLSRDILNRLDGKQNGLKTEFIILEPLRKEDYME